MWKIYPIFKVTAHIFFRIVCINKNDFFFENSIQFSINHIGKTNGLKLNIWRMQFYGARCLTSMTTQWEAQTHFLQLFRLSLDYQKTLCRSFQRKLQLKTTCLGSVPWFQLKLMSLSLRFWKVLKQCKEWLIFYRGNLSQDVARKYNFRQKKYRDIFKKECRYFSWLKLFFGATST